MLKEINSSKELFDVSLTTIARDFELGIGSDEYRFLDKYLEHHLPIDFVNMSRDEIVQFRYENSLVTNVRIGNIIDFQAKMRERTDKGYMKFLIFVTED